MNKRFKPEVGEVIEVNHRPVFSTSEGFNAVDATVVDTLDVQFFCELQDGPTAFRFYKDQGDSWRFKK